MRIYLGWTGNPPVHKWKEKYDCGWVITPENHNLKVKNPFIIDNGAFYCWKNQLLWNETIFYEFLRKYIGYKPDFTVVPDIVAGGCKSLKFSINHVHNIPAPRYLAVQDGMKINEITPFLEEFDGIFVGGTIPWKISTMQAWSDTAHLYNLKCHVGRIGTYQGYVLCHAYGIDSVDGTNPSRNNNEEPLYKFYDYLNHQSKLEDYEVFDNGNSR